MARARAIAPAPILAAVALALAMAGAEAAGVAVRTVTIDGFAFEPSTIVVKQGETVEWKNADPVPHSVTAKDAGLDSGAIPANGRYRFTATRKGRFAYVCTLHPIMKGEIVVE